VQDGAAKTLVAVTCAAPEERCAALEAAGVEVVRAGEGERVDLAALMRLLAAREYTSVFVEGGGTLNFSLLAAGLVDKIHAFIAPKIVGGKAALTPVEGAGFAELADAAVLTGLTAEQVAADILLTGYVAKGAR
ncbi:MAG: RibD family protein, partial [Selenomonas sp.]